MTPDDEKRLAEIRPLANLILGEYRPSGLQVLQLRDALAFALRMLDESDRARIAAEAALAQKHQSWEQATNALAEEMSKVDVATEALKEERAKREAAENTRTLALENAGLEMIRAEKAEARVAELESALAAERNHADAIEHTLDVSQWVDSPLPEDAAIDAAHPLKTKRHDLFSEAMRLVGARQSKGGLVELVNWLLAGRTSAEDRAATHLGDAIEADEKLRTANARVAALEALKESR